MKIHILKPSITEYHISPQVVLTGKPFTICIKGLGIESKLTVGEIYKVRIIPQEQIATAKTLVIGDVGCYDEIDCTVDADNCIHFTYSFPREQVYTIRLLDSAGKRLNDFKIFSAKIFFNSQKSLPKTVFYAILVLPNNLQKKKHVHALFSQRASYALFLAIILSVLIWIKTQISRDRIYI